MRDDVTLALKDTCNHFFPFLFLESVARLSRCPSTVIVHTNSSPPSSISRVLPLSYLLFSRLHHAYRSSSIASAGFDVFSSEHFGYLATHTHTSLHICLFQ